MFPKKGVKREAAEGKGFPFTERESRRKKLFPDNYVKRKGSRGKRFSLSRERESRRKKLFPKNGVKREGGRGERFSLLQRRIPGGKIVPLDRNQKERVAEGKGFPIAEKKSRRKNCSTRMESKEMVGERISLSRKGKQEENFFPKNGVKKRS